MSFFFQVLFIFCFWFCFFLSTVVFFAYLVSFLVLVVEFFSFVSYVVFFYAGTLSLYCLLYTLSAISNYPIKSAQSWASLATSQTLSPLYEIQLKKLHHFLTCLTAILTGVRRVRKQQKLFVELAKLWWNHSNIAGNARYLVCIFLVNAPLPKTWFLAPETVSTDITAHPLGRLRFSRTPK